MIDYDMTSLIFPPENEYDNIEYKRELNDRMEQKRITQLSTQMLRRINNGIEVADKPEAIYYIGLNDNGSLANKSQESINKSIEIIKLIAQKNSCEIKEIVINSYNSINSTLFFIAKIVIIKNRCSINDVRVLFLGPPGTGKTTTLSTLTNDPFINNRKITTCNIFYNSGQQLLYDSDSFMSIQGMVSSSDRIVTITDIPGNKKYFKDTMKSIFANKYNHIYIFYNLGADISIVIKYIILLKFLQISYTLINTISKYIPEELESESNNIIFIGQDITQLKEHINTVLQVKEEIPSNDVIFSINNTMSSNFGTIVDGILHSGFIKNGDKLLIGPNNDTEFCQIKINTIHKKQTPYDSINYNEDASILINTNNTFKITKGMIIFSKNLITNFKNTFYIKINNHFGVKIEKYMKFTAFMSNGCNRISIIKDLFIDSTYHIYHCKLSKDKKRLFIENEKIGLRYGNNIIEAVISLDV